MRNLNKKNVKESSLPKAREHKNARGHSKREHKGHAVKRPSVLRFFVPGLSAPPNQNYNSEAARMAQRPPVRKLHSSTAHKAS